MNRLRWKRLINRIGGKRNFRFARYTQQRRLVREKPFEIHEFSNGMYTTNVFVNYIIVFHRP